MGGVQTLLVGEEPGVVLEVIDLGATVHRLLVTDAEGRRRNVVLNHPDRQAYVDGTDYRGAVVGRFANRIAGGSFELDGRTVQLATNEGPNTLHGGPDGFHRRAWEVDRRTSTISSAQAGQPRRRPGLPGRADGDGHLHRDKRQRCVSQLEPPPATRRPWPT